MVLCRASGILCRLAFISSTILPKYRQTTNKDCTTTTTNQWQSRSNTDALSSLCSTCCTCVCWAWFCLPPRSSWSRAWWRCSAGLSYRSRRDPRTPAATATPSAGRAGTVRQRSARSYTLLLVVRDEGRSASGAAAAVPAASTTSRWEWGSRGNGWRTVQVRLTYVAGIRRSRHVVLPGKGTARLPPCLHACLLRERAFHSFC